jgi:hypothetical protein
MAQELHLRVKFGTASPTAPTEPAAPSAFSRHLTDALSAVEARGTATNTHTDALGRTSRILRALEVVSEATGVAGGDRTLLLYATGWLKEDSEEATNVLCREADPARVTVVRVPWDSGSMGEIFRAMVDAHGASAEARRREAPPSPARGAAGAGGGGGSPLAWLGSRVDAAWRGVRDAVMPYANAGVAGVKQAAAEGNYWAKEREARVAGALLAEVLAELHAARRLDAYEHVVLMGHSLGAVLVLHALAALNSLPGGSGGGGGGGGGGGRRGGAGLKIAHAVLMGAPQAGPELPEAWPMPREGRGGGDGGGGGGAAPWEDTRALWASAASSCGTVWNVFHRKDKALKIFSGYRKLRSGGTRDFTAVGLREVDFPPAVVNVDVTALLPINQQNPLSHAYSPFVGKILREARPVMAVIPLRVHVEAFAPAVGSPSKGPRTPTRPLLWGGGIAGEGGAEKRN